MSSNFEREVARNSANVTNPRGRFWLKIIGLLFVAFLLGGGTAGLISYISIQNAAKDATELAQQIQQKCESPGIVDPDLAQFCPKATQVVAAAPNQVKSDPVPGPPGQNGQNGSNGATGPTGLTGATGPPPSNAQVKQAVALFCEDTGRCEGQDGANATPAQIAIAVSSYCDDRGRCRGPAGSNGTDGADGADAPPITQSQIIDALDQYCGNHNNCQGPTGDTGPAGPQGTSGVAGVTDNCDAAPDGKVIADVDAAYDAGSQTVVITCTYKDDQTGIVPVP